MKFTAFLDKKFKLSENGTTVRTEIVAGLTTFFTMAYIIFVNPKILGAAGMDPSSVLLATCISAAIGTFLMAILSNYPLAQAPGMGLNALFAFTICGQMGYTWQAALAAVFISGMIFIILTATGFRTIMIKAIPQSLKKAISAGIGLFIALVGLINGGVIVSGGTPVTLAFFNNPLAIMTIVGLVITIILMVLKVRGAIFWGLIINAVLCIAVGGIQYAAVDGAAATAADPEFVTWASQLGINFNFSWDFNFSTAGQFVHGFGDLFSVKETVGVAIVSVITILLTLTMVDMFDTMGTLIGAAEKGNLLDENGELPKAGKAFMADAIATSVGAVLGTSTVTTYVESTAGIAEGGKTGLTAMVVGCMFLISIVLYPFVGLISSAATAPALVIVGVLMMGSVKDINWHDMSEAIPCFLTMVIMPFGYSIADGIGFGFISYVVIRTTLDIAASLKKAPKTTTEGMNEGEIAAAMIENEAEGGKKKFKLTVHPLLIVFAALFLVRYIFLAVTNMPS